LTVKIRTRLRGGAKSVFIQAESWEGWPAIPAGDGNAASHAFRIESGRVGGGGVARETRKAVSAGLWEGL